MRTIQIRRPDDWHVHLRDGALLAVVAPHSHVYGRVLAMPNLRPPVTTAARGRAYQEALAANGLRDARLAAYLTDATDPDDLAAAFADGVFLAAKWYPAHATTHSESGVTNVAHIADVLDRMEGIGMPLCVHGEVTDGAVDVFERERVFLDRVLLPVLHRWPRLRCVVEHATTRDAVQFVRAHPNTAATITPHHLWWNRNALFAGGLRPHAYCLPVLKREEDRQALLAAATSDTTQFFAGTDSAPHRVQDKESDCGCAGVFNAATALPAYATLFEQAGALDRLEAFTSLRGAAFYGVQAATDTVTLVQEEWTPPTYVCEGEDRVRVFLGGEPLSWRVVDA